MRLGLRGSSSSDSQRSNETLSTLGVMRTKRHLPLPDLPIVFIGSSTEGLEIGRYLQLVLEEAGECVVTRWDQGVFTASSYTMESLTQAAKGADFAILVATADDTVESRGASRPMVRDNVIFELGLFIGALGRERTYIVADRDSDLQLPTDLAGITWLPYKRRADGNQRAAVNGAAIAITERVRHLGRRETSDARKPTRGVLQELETEIERICVSAVAQGWRIKTNSETTLRLQTPTGRRFTFSIGEPSASRTALRTFAADLRANGLRVSQSVRRPVTEAPQVR